MQWLLAHFRRHCQNAVGDPIWQEALVPHWCSPGRPTTSKLPLPATNRGSPCNGCWPISAGTVQSAVGDPIWQEALVPHWLEELQISLRLCALSAETYQGIGGSPSGRRLGAALFRGAVNSLRLCTLSTGTNQSIVGDPVWQDALVPHYLEELQGSLRLCIYPQAPTKSL